jgi:hypothetical protein
MKHEVFNLQVPTRFEIEREIHNLNAQIETNSKALKDYKLFQSGEITRDEVMADLESLREQRKQLLNMIANKQYSK